MKLVIIVYAMLLASKSFSQVKDSSFNNLKKAMDYHIKIFESNNKEAIKIFYTLDIDSGLLSKSNLAYVENKPSFFDIETGKKGFYIKFKIKMKDGFQYLECINFSFIKKNKRRIFLTNLGNSVSYFII